MDHEGEDRLSTSSNLPLLRHCWLPVISLRIPWALRVQATWGVWSCRSLNCDQQLQQIVLMFSCFIPPHFSCMVMPLSREDRYKGMSWAHILSPTLRHSISFSRFCSLAAESHSW